MRSSGVFCVLIPLQASQNKRKRSVHTSIFIFIETLAMDTLRILNNKVKASRIDPLCFFNICTSTNPTIDARTWPSRQRKPALVFAFNRTIAAASKLFLFSASSFISIDNGMRNHMKSRDERANRSADPLLTSVEKSSQRVRASSYMLGELRYTL